MPSNTLLPCTFALSWAGGISYIVIRRWKEMSNVERGCGSGFALIVVLFILLIIVGASGYNRGFHGYGYGDGWYY
jgi:uncharacterized protein (TIGR01732 family)